jgi:hypothetical protein
MRAAGPLPIAPGPMPGEAVLSWVARIAARYDLSLSELMACLRGGVGVYSPRMAALDWKEDLELEGLLARAACLDRSEIRAMAPVGACLVSRMRKRRRCEARRELRTGCVATRLLRRLSVPPAVSRPELCRLWLPALLFSAFGRSPASGV